MTHIPLQGQENSKLPRWINLRQLGRLFNMTGPATGKRLDMIMLRKDKLPTEHATKMGIGRVLPSSAHQEHPVVQWHAVKAAQALMESGWAPQDTFGVFCRAAVDKVRTALSGFSDDENAGRADTWWITIQIKSHLQQVPENRTDDFIDALVDGVRTRKGRRVRDELLYGMLAAVGELDAHQARMRARELRAHAPQSAARSAARHRL